jgi:hypothetical protein
MRLDAEKYARLEGRLLAVADAVIAITAQDADRFRRSNGRVDVVWPAYLGPKADRRIIDAETPKSLLLLGSFGWGAKQRNLEDILVALHRPLKDAGIAIRIVGNVATSVRAAWPQVEFCGTVNDYKAIAAACRGGLVAEDLGGGFKLKILDYAFMRLPIFGLAHAVAGMTAEERSAMILAEDLTALARAIIENFDGVASLNRRQDALHTLVSQRFDVATVGVRLCAALGWAKT